MRNRSFVFTKNNYTQDDETVLQAIQCKYVVYGREVAPTTGTPHLQGYISFDNPRTLNGIRTLLTGCHIEVARGTSLENFTYCTKGGDFFERGQRPLTQQEKGAGEKRKWDEIWDLAKQNKLEEIESQIKIRYYHTLKRVAQDHMVLPSALESVCGVWIYGSSGSGKSHSAITQNPGAYMKPRNKWWDGYQGEDVVILDDVDKFDVGLGGFLKHWGDKWPFIGEMKGGSRTVRPKKFIVTSQYQINDIWSDEETRVALNRRFKSIQKFPDQDIFV